MEKRIKAAKENLKEYKNVQYVHGNHDEIKSILENLKIQKVDGILLDLGVSSYQLDERNRGFSYLGENQLDMRMDKSQTLTAEMVVNTYSQEELANIIYQEDGTAKSPVLKFVTEEQAKAIQERAGAKAGDIIFFVADKPTAHRLQMGGFQLAVNEHAPHHLKGLGQIDKGQL